jgi:DNA-binding MarR family transcriptional regulator/N-acetylglutamate synthase-like GNAT family acetyltransferase
MTASGKILSVAAEFATLTRRTLRAAEGMKLTEARILLELSGTPALTDADVTLRLGSDKGHISKVLRSMVSQGWLEAAPGEHKQQRRLFLTEAGRDLAVKIGSQQAQAAAAMVPDLTPGELSLLHGISGKVKGRHAKRAASFHSSVRPASADDLAWLLGESLSTPSEYRSGKAQLHEQAQRLAYHLNTMINYGECSWVALNWGERVAGCVLSPVAERLEEGMIELLVLPAENTGVVARDLLRCCLAKAEEMTFEKLHLALVLAPEALKEALSELGFSPVAKERAYVAYEWRDKISWCRSLLPA